MASAHNALLTDISSFRSVPERELGYVSVGRFKRVKQMEALLKKYRFATDAFSDQELSERSLNGFLDVQARVHRPLPLKQSGFEVLKRARLIARRILGPYPGDEVVNYVKFGKKSSIGCPLDHAYIDNKLSMKRAFTGTCETTAYFMDQVLPGDAILQRILKNHDIDSLHGQLNLKHLNLVEVPKTWKTYRLITPLTLIGLFFSYGVGRVVTSRLSDAGLDIGKLQAKHRDLVRDFSVSCKHATADLSCASDSITSELLNRVLPRPWYEAVKKTFVRRLRVGDEEFSTASVLPMGNGATFPIETLVFYSIIKAIGELTGIKGTYSVYGDDLIYPSRLHRYVVGCFPQFHFALNHDKTFVSYPFRESCGSDFYRGQDVRPFYFKGESQQLSRVRYEALLYKVYNGLIARWDPLEIRETLTWILSELAMTTDKILRVPPSFPDYSGLKVSSPRSIPLDYNLLPFSPTVIQMKNGSRWFQFDFLTETPQKRVVKTTEPYYWLALQGLDDDTLVDEYSWLIDPKSACSIFAGNMAVSSLLEMQENLGLIPSGPYSPVDKPNCMLSWKKVTKKKVIFQQRRKVVRRITKHVAVVASRKGATVSTATTKTDSISDWI
jgi:hypothetical protein